jgi:hypothetical protein
MKTWPYPSSSGGKTHTVTWHDDTDGRIICSIETCQGFRNKRKDKPRTCRHVEDVIKRLGLNTVQQGDYLFATAGQPMENAKSQVVLARTETDIQSAFSQAELDGYVNPMLGQAIALKLPSHLTPAQRTEEQWKHINANYLTGYIWEEKWDGQRVVSGVKQSQDVKSWSRPRPGEGVLGHPRTLPPHLVAHLKALPDGTYDGEEVVPGGRSWAVTDLAYANQKALVLFDLLKLQGKSLMDLPIEIRRQLLAEILKLAKSPYLLMSETFTPGRPGVEAIWARGGEGAMIKRAGSLYRPGWRSSDWIKVKLWDYSAVTLTGFEARKEGPYSVMLFRFDNGVESKCKTLGNKWLREFEKNGPSYIGKRFIVKHQGVTGDLKPRHPQFFEFDHFAGEGEGD